MTKLKSRVTHTFETYAITGGRAVGAGPHQVDLICNIPADPVTYDQGALTVVRAR